jgi:hypothetical protein
VIGLPEAKVPAALRTAANSIANGLQFGDGLQILRPSNPHDHELDAVLTQAFQQFEGRIHSA